MEQYSPNRLKPRSVVIEESFAGKLQEAEGEKEAETLLRPLKETLPLQFEDGIRDSLAIYNAMEST